jgi:hypothetical protein
LYEVEIRYIHFTGNISMKTTSRLAIFLCYVFKIDVFIHVQAYFMALCQLLMLYRITQGCTNLEQEFRDGSQIFGKFGQPTIRYIRNDAITPNSAFVSSRSWSINVLYQHLPGYTEGSQKSLDGRGSPTAKNLDFRFPPRC